MWPLNRKTDKQLGDGQSPTSHRGGARPPGPRRQGNAADAGGCLTPAPSRRQGWDWRDSRAQENQSLQIKEKTFIRSQQRKEGVTGGVHHTAKDPAPRKDSK